MSSVRRRPLKAFKEQVAKLVAVTTKAVESNRSATRQYQALYVASKAEIAQKLEQGMTRNEMLLNGVSLGKRSGVNGVFTWENVTMAEGMNDLEARSDSGIDHTRIEIAEDKIHHGIN